jgi:hypothetical protein
MTKILKFEKVEILNSYFYKLVNLRLNLDHQVQLKFKYRLNGSIFLNILKLKVKGIIYVNL